MLIMRIKERSLLFKRLGKTRRNSIWIRGRRELIHPFSGTILRDNHILESPGRLKWVGRCQDNHLWNVGAVKETIGTKISPTGMIKCKRSTMFSKLKNWRRWAV
jgi:hypothetical protein